MWRLILTVAATKPVVVLKAGRSAEAARAVSSHTGALAGSDRAFEAAVKQAGAVRVHSVEALFDYVYRSDHRGVMVRRREWFEKPEGPYQVLWWIERAKLPTVEEGLARLAHLERHGPTPYAFTFKTAFPPGASEPLDMRPDPYCVGWA